MLTPTAPQRLPSVNACQMGRVVMGSTMAQIASNALQLSTIKLLGEAHYHFQRGSNFGSCAFRHIPEGRTKGYEETWQILYATTPLTTHIAFELMYDSIYYNDDVPALQVSVKKIVSGSIDGTIDAGVILDDYLESMDSATGEPKILHSGWQARTAPTGATTRISRPLYIPAANRGEVVCIRISTAALSVLALHLIDVYQEA